MSRTKFMGIFLIILGVISVVVGIVRGDMTSSAAMFIGYLVPALLGAVILIGQIVAPVALAHRLNKRFDPIVARVHTPAKTTTHGIPHVIEHRVTLVMEHRRHLLPAGGH